MRNIKVNSFYLTENRAKTENLSLNMKIKVCARINKIRVFRIVSELFTNIKV